MMKSIGKLFITLSILTILALIVILVYNSGRTYYNDENETGNTAGNIYNGGLFCEKDGKIYFSNDQDDGSLYVMKSDGTSLKKLSDDKAVYINVDENYIYYVRANDTKANNGAGFLMFYNTGVFRIKRNGSDLKAFTGDPAAYLTLKGNNIFFQRYQVGVGLYLYKYKIDGKEERLLIQDAVIPAAVEGTSLYYAGYSSDHNIDVINLESYTTQTALKGSFYYPIFTENYIYYMDPSDDYKIYRMNRDGTQPERLTDMRCSTYNITRCGNFLYYQADNNKDSGIYRLNLKTMEQEMLQSGDYKQIHATTNYVFFKDFDNTNTYMVDADGYPAINIFDPSASNKKKDR